MDAHLVCDVAQSEIEMREMGAGEIADEDALHFVVADAPVQPADEQCELHQGWN